MAVCFFVKKVEIVGLARKLFTFYSTLPLVVFSHQYEFVPLAKQCMISSLSDKKSSSTLETVGRVTIKM